MAVMDPRSNAVYRKAIEELFAFLKTTSAPDDLWSKCIPLEGGAGYLLPVCELHTHDEPLLRELTRWRDENAFAYPTQFKPTLESTRNWLRQRLLDVPDRILFLVTDRTGRPLGHLGYASCLNDTGTMEIDNVVRGVKEAGPGLFAAAMTAALEWARTMFGPEEIDLRVFEDNDHAVTFYRKLGFRNDTLIPLRREEKPGMISYVPAGPGQRSERNFLRMVYAPSPRKDGFGTLLTAGPSISAKEASYALDAARYGWNHRWADYIKRFESSFASYLGVKYALSTSSCTGALQLSLLALDIGPGDEVIVPDLTWVATANAVLYTGATPVFADIEPDTWCIDPASIKKLIGPRTKAILPVHLYGHPARMDAVLEIAREHRLRVVEDAAPSIGAEFKGRRTGTFGDFAAFSFQGAKLVVTGEGGMLVTNDEALYKKVYEIWDQGRIPGTFWIEKLGWKYKMSNIQAAIGLGQLERTDVLVEAKRRIFGWYADGLEGIDCIQLNREASWARSIYWMSSLLLKDNAPVDAETLRAELKKDGIDSRPVFPAISQYPMWPKRSAPQPVAKRVGERAINLPSGVCLKKDEVDHVCRSIRRVLKTG